MRNLGLSKLFIKYQLYKKSTCLRLFDNGSIDYNNGIPDIRDSAASENTGPIDICLNGIDEINLGLLALLGTLAGLRRVKQFISSMLSLLMLFILQGEAEAQNTKQFQQGEYQRHFYIGAGIGPSTSQPSTALSKYTLVVRVEVQAHTDSYRTLENNQRVSDRRAKSVVNYLVSRGVPKHRLVAKGYGETVL